MLHRWHTASREQAGSTARTGAAMIGTGALLTMGVVGVAAGCTTVVDGTPGADIAQAPSYRTSLSLSAASSSRLESQRRAAEAMRGLCVDFAARTGEAIEMINNYADAYNEDGDVAAAVDPAVSALNRSADFATDALRDDDRLPADFGGVLRRYAKAARALAGTITRNDPPTVYNRTKGQLSEVRELGMQLCRQY